MVVGGGGSFIGSSLGALTAAFGEKSDNKLFSLKEPSGRADHKNSSLLFSLFCRRDKKKKKKKKKLSTLLPFPPPHHPPPPLTPPPANERNQKSEEGFSHGRSYCGLISPPPTPPAPPPPPSVAHFFSCFGFKDAAGGT